MRLWFDMDTCELITEEKMIDEYQDWLVERVAEEGPDYVRANHEDFTYSAFIKCNVTLYRVTNAANFEEVKK